MAKKKTKSKTSSVARITKYDCEEVDVDDVMADIDDQIKELEILKSKMAVIKRITKSGEKPKIYAMPSWRVARQKITAFLTGIGKTINEIKDASV